MRKFLQNNHNKYKRLPLRAFADNLVSYLKKGGWAA